MAERLFVVGQDIESVKLGTLATDIGWNILLCLTIVHQRQRLLKLAVDLLKRQHSVVLIKVDKLAIDDEVFRFSAQVLGQQRLEVPELRILPIKVPREHAEIVTANAELGSEDVNLRPLTVVFVVC